MTESRTGGINIMNIIKSITWLIIVATIVAMSFYVLKRVERKAMEDLTEVVINHKTFKIIERY